MVLFPSPTLIVFTFCVLWLKVNNICSQHLDVFKEFIDEHHIGESIRIWFEFKAEIVVEWVSGPPIPWRSPSPSPGPSRWLMWSMQMNLFCEWVSSSWISYPLILFPSSGGGTQKQEHRREWVMREEWQRWRGKGWWTATAPSPPSSRSPPGWWMMALLS